MTNTRDWQRNRELWIRVLEKQTGAGLTVWNRKIRKQKFDDERGLRQWLSELDVTGYARQLLIMERFGYPDFVRATADELIARQYSDRPQLRPIYDTLIEAAAACGEVIIQARKTYVSLVSPRRTFARIQPSTKARVDLGLRLDLQRPAGRLRPSTLHETMRFQIGLASPGDVDAEVRKWLCRAYDENA